MTVENLPWANKILPPQISVPILMEDFKTSAQSNILLGKVYTLCEARKFTDEKGNIDEIGDASISTEEAALLHFLVRYLKADITFETGFGGGGSACVFVGSKEQGRWSKGRHTSIDPHGLAGAKGSIVAGYLDRNFKKRFERVRELSEIALPSFVNKYRNKVKLSLIDGGHLFEHAIMDFVFLDRMCAPGGCIVIDDASAPAVASAINFIAANRDEYTLQRPFHDTVLFWKTGEVDKRTWCHFRPFEVSPDLDWGHEHDYR